MSQTILIEDNSDLRKLFAVNLISFTGTDVIERDNAKHAIELLRILPSINLIICRNKIAQENTGNDLLNFIEQNQLDIPIIVMGKNREIEKKVINLSEPFSWELLISESARMLGITLEDLAKKVKPDYVPLSINFFHEINTTPCDIYIRIRQKADEYQFVKRIHANDTFDDEVINKYYNSGLRNFYVARDYQEYFVTFVTNKLIAKLEQDLTIEERISVTSKTYELVKTQVLELGFDDRSADLADSGIESMITSVKESPKLATLIKFLLSSKITFAYQHAHLVSVISYYILSKLNTFKPIHLELVTSAAFFSDISLKSQQQLQINSQHDLDNSDLSEDEKHEVTYHAKKAAELVRDYPRYADELQTIILQHHGTADGIGFEDDPPEELHPLSKIFMVADAFVKILLGPNSPKNKQDILPILYQRFRGKSFQKIVRSLEKRFES